jgi:homospermidine synthase
MSNHPVHVNFPGRLIMVGFGSIGQGVLPLILRHVGIATDRITIVTADDRGSAEAAEYGIKFVKQPLTRENFKRVLDPLVGRGDFLLNLSVDVSSIALIKLCWDKAALYLDTCIEPWPGGYTDPTISPAKRTNYALREEALALREGKTRAPTAVLTHGANPGLVSHFVKQALLNLAGDLGLDAAEPATREEWGRLAQKLGVQVIHIAERDTQVGTRPKELGEFVNTWSVDGFVGEGAQPAELGWGSHEKNWPRDGKKHDFGRGSAIYLMQPGAATRVRTWTPLAGPFHGFLITHGESISISDYLTIKKGDKVEYRPTVHYAYHPCDAAVLSVHELAGRNWEVQERKRVMMEEIVKGVDELGRAARRSQAQRLLVRLAAPGRRGAAARAAQQRHVAAGDGRCARRAHLGGREPEQRCRRARRDGLPARARDLHAVSRPSGRRVRRMASAGRARATVPGGSRRDRSLAVQERPRLLRPNRGARRGGGRLSVRRGPVSHRPAAQVVRALPLLDVPACAWRRVRYLGGLGKRAIRAAVR